MSKVTLKRSVSKSIKGTKFGDMLKEVKSDFRKSAYKWRQGIASTIEGEVTGTDKFFEELGEAVDSLALTEKQRQLYYQYRETQTQDNLADAIRQLSREFKITDTYEVDHLTMAPINQNLTLVILALMEEKDLIDSGAQAVTGATALGYEGEFAQTARNEFKNGDTTNLTQAINKTLSRLRKVRASGEVIERLYNANKDITPKALTEGLKELQDTQGRIDIDFLKEKDLGLGKDGQLAKFAITAKADHEKKTRWQRAQGVLRSRILGGNPKFKPSEVWLKQLTDEFGQAVKNAGITSITGSESIADGLGKDMADVFSGKKPRKRKTKSKLKDSNRGNIRVKKPKSLRGVKSKLSEVNTISQLGVMRASRANNSKNIERGTEDIQKELNKLTTLINQRLSAQVRRNMGYPYLTNRSGTFSNSVRLLSLRKANKTIVGEYTYMRTGGGTPPRSGQPGVYETFEGTGVYSDRWLKTYDPKLLISKSIRELAQEYTTQKFTLRRR